MDGSLAGAGGGGGVVKGCHLVGSVPFVDAETVFRKCSAALPHRLKRIPDGETGARAYFTMWQTERIPQDILADFQHNGEIGGHHDWTPEQVAEKIAQIRENGIESGYDDAAIESYARFRQLKDEGILDADVRMQVCIPTVPNIILPFVQRRFLVDIEPLYEEALFRAMRRIQDSIPHADLAFQIDVACDTAFWESTKREAAGTGLEWFKPWFEGDIRDYATAYLVRMISQVDEDVEVGIHNCYGDMNHQHWYEPPTLEVVVERGIRMIENSPRPINWFHCPVPKSATAQFGERDNLKAYLAPLKTLWPYLEKHQTELYLGVVHEHEPELTRQMIAAALKVVPEFGVATECGGGRMQAGPFEDALSISRDVSQPFLPDSPIGQ